MTSFLTSSSVLRRSVGALLLVAVIIATTNGQATATTEWGQATPVVFAVGAEDGDANTGIGSVSCASAGNCVAVGRYRKPGGAYEAFTMSMVAGVWGQPTVPVFADGVQRTEPFSGLTSVSCASAGNCVAVGYFITPDPGFVASAFTMSMVAWVWGQATPAVFGSGVQNANPDSQFYSVSCGSAGNCVAAGYFKKLVGGNSPFTMSMVSGVWGQATPAVFDSGVQQNANPDAGFNSVSCGSAGNCVAAGYFKNLSGGNSPFTMSMVTGVWGQATSAVFANGVQNAQPNSEFKSVSCASAGNCVAAGYFRNLAAGYETEAFTMSMVAGVWGQATPAVFANGTLNATPDTGFLSVSCASAGNCVAVGYVRTLAGGTEAFTMSMVAGVWGQATPAVFASGVQNASPFASFSSVSCASAGNCVAVGNFLNLAGNGFEAFTMSMVAGVWGQATPAVFANGVQNANPNAGFLSVSCASAGNCVAAGYFQKVPYGNLAFTMTAVNNTPAPTTTVAPSTTVAPLTTVAPSTTVAPPTESVVVALPVANTPLVANNSLSAGTELTITAGGFTPGEFVQLIVASTPQVIGSGYADAQGFVTLTGTIPVDLTSGNHTLAVFAPASGAGFKQPITVSGLSLPATGSNYNGVLILALLAVVVGTVVVVRRQRLVA
jgi:hypothetical protein